MPFERQQSIATGIIWVINKFCLFLNNFKVFTPRSFHHTSYTIKIAFLEQTLTHSHANTHFFHSSRISLKTMSTSPSPASYPTCCKNFNVTKLKKQNISNKYFSSPSIHPFQNHPSTTVPGALPMSRNGCDGYLPRPGILFVSLKQQVLMSSNMDGPVKISKSTVMKTFFLKRRLVLEKTLDQEINHHAGLVASGGPMGGTGLKEKSVADFDQTKLYDSAAVSSKNGMIEVPTMSKKMNLRLPCMTWWLKCVSFLWFLSMLTIVHGKTGKLMCN